MPSPDQPEPSMVSSDTGEQAPEEGRADNPGEGTDTEGRWSDEEWRRWNAWHWGDGWSHGGSTSETRQDTSEHGSYGGYGGGRRQSGMTTSATDPWSSRDPWSTYPLGSGVVDQDRRLPSTSGASSSRSVLSPTTR